jgi:mono/diheme cytochrome c family protein
VTEIPEHLLKRSRDRRAALGLGGGDDAAAGAGETPAATPAAAAGTAPAAPPPPSGPPARKAAAEAAPPPPPKPDPPYIVAAKTRRKIPFWAMMALSLMPLWLFMYVRALTVPPKVATGPIGVGAEIYTNCSSCHGSAGEGGVGRPFSNGEVLKTFPHIEDQIRFVYFGTANYNVAGVKIYGNPQREGGPHLAGSLGPMPAWGADAGGSLSDSEILAVVCHERYTVGGADPTSTAYEKEFADWCADDAPTYAALQAGTTLADLGTTPVNDASNEPINIIPIGDAPVAGSPPG